MNDLLRDIRFGCRLLWRSPGFTTVALLTIAIGIGANAAIFSFFDGVFLRPIAYNGGERMVKVSEKSPTGTNVGFSTLDYLELEKQTSIFEFIAAQNWNFGALTGLENVVEVPNERVRTHFFDVFQIKPEQGRYFMEGEDQPGHDLAVISHAFWVSQFGKDANILGKTFDVDNVRFAVVGVLPPGVFDRTITQFWRPLTFDQPSLTRDRRWLNVWGKLRPGVTLEQARVQLDTLALRNAHDFPDADKGWGVTIESFRSILVRSDVKRSLFLLMGAVGMVLLIACANLANLTLSRGAAREREIAVRASLGAGRWRIARQFLAESMILSLAGGALGLLVALGGFVGLKRLLPTDYMPASQNIALDGRILLFVLVLAILTGLAFGLYPAIKASRPDLMKAIKQGGLGASVGPSHRGFRHALVVVEVALAFVLLAGAGLLIRSFFKLQQVDIGVDSRNIVTAWMIADTKRYSEAAKFNAYLRQLKEHIGALPGVQEVAFTTAMPMEGWGYGMRFQIAGQKVVEPEKRPVCYFKIVSPSYFSALRMRVLRGRFLSDHDLDGSAPAAVINQTMAKKFFENQEPLGQHILVSKILYGKNDVGQDVSWEVVGVVADEKLGNLGAADDQSPGLYVSFEQSPQPYYGILARCAIGTDTIQRSLAGAVHEVDRKQALVEVQTLDDIKARSVVEQRLHSLLLGVFALIAVLLSAIGIYGVISYSVIQRTREIGIRCALGANHGDILWLVLRSGLLLTAMGLLIGFAGSMAVAQILATLLFQVGKYDGVTTVSVTVMLVAIAVLATYLPARRAVRIAPTVALKCD